MASSMRILMLKGKPDSTLRSYVESRGYTLGEYGSAGELLDQLDHNGTTLIIADEALAGVDYAAFLEKVKSANPSVEVILLEEQPPTPKVVDALRLGFVDVLERPIEISLLDKAVTRALADAQTEQRIMRLSTRELDVLRLLAHGLPNKHVASRLGISHRTVEVYRARIMDKVSVTSFAGLLLVVLRSRHVFPRGIDANKGPLLS